MQKSGDTLAAMAGTWRQDVCSGSDCVNGINDVGRKLKTLYESAIAVMSYLNRKDKKYKRPPCDKRPCTNQNAGR